MKKRTAAYGSWPSPLSAAAVARTGVKRTDLLVTDDAVTWCERRPAEGGRNAIVRILLDLPGQDVEPASTAVTRIKHDLVSRSRNVRSTAHEYGGGTYAIAGHDLVFVDLETRSVIAGDLRREADRPPDISLERVLIEDTSGAYADLTVDRQRHRLLAAREDSSVLGEPVASLIALPLERRVDSPQTLITARDLDADFLSSPRLSPDGNQLAWLSWSHPNMPWDATCLWLSDLDAQGCPISPRQVGGESRLGGADQESIFQPEWSPDGVLHFVSDRSGWWNLYRLDDSDPRPLFATDAEFGLPQWVFGMSTYAIPRPDLLVATWCRRGLWSLGSLDPSAQSSELRPVAFSPTASEQETAETVEPDSDHPRFTHFDSVSASASRAAVLAAGPRDAQRIVVLDLASRQLNAPVNAPTHEGAGAGSESSMPARLTLRCQVDVPCPSDLDAPFIAVGQPIEFASGDRRAHAFFYPPTSGTTRAPAKALPPLIVKTHGGPTAAASNAFDPAIQFWTSRGFALVDVNYSGSTGYGRAYRQLLDGFWGVRDVEDCVAATAELASRGLVDSERLIIRGGSAGGYTTLAALTFTNVFRAGASYYGIGDLEALARDTHKFESRYLDRLVGPYPERADLYRERSPRHHVSDLDCPVIFFQGSEDKVVPPSQSEAMVAALSDKGVATAYVLYEGEGHGFRQEKHIIHALDTELAFYRRCLDIDSDEV